MKKLFTLAAAVLASFSLWAALPSLPTSTLTLPDFPESGWKGVLLPSVIDTTNNWYIVSPYEIYQSKFTWSNTAGGGSNDGSWNATGIFPANTRFTTTDKDSKYYYATLKEFDGKKHYYGYRVTNCEAVALIGASGSNKKRTIYLAAYEITNNTLPDSTNATKTASFESSDLTQIMIEDLDASKEYYIYVTQKGTGTSGSSSGNSSFYSIAFKSAPAANYTITYDANGGTGTMENTTNTIAENEFTYDGKDFVEWNTQADGKGTSYAPGAKATSDLDLFAIWQDHVAKYTLVYKVDGDSVASEVVNVDGTPVGITAPTKDCYTFAGWDPALNEVTGTDGATVYVNATWDPVYSLSATLISAENVTAKANVNTILAASNIVSSITFASGQYEFTSNETKKGYYGYKVNTANDKLTFLVQKGYEVQVLFGSLANNPTIKVNGTTKSLDADRTSGNDAENTFTYYASEEDALISITFGSGTSTLKKIDIAEYVVSNDATIKSLTVNGVAVEAVNDVYSYVVGSTDDATKVAVEFVLNNAKATADKESGFEIDVPEAGAAANTATITVTAEDETEKVYTVSVTKATAANDDATLSALSVTGFTLAPAFDPEVTEYTITKAYEAALPAVSAVFATPNDINASAEVVLTENVFTITVTAEDDETTKEYTITVNNAPAVKAINEVILSNGYSAYIPEGQTVEPFVINGFYLAGEDAPTVSSYKVNNGTTWAIEDNTVTLTGVDESTATYSLVLAAVEPIEFTTDKITFDGSETWIKSGYGFDATKKWRFSKTDDDYSREITGKTHIELFLPACDTIVLSEATGNARDIRVYVNGAALGEKVSLPKNGDLTLVIAQAKAFMLTIASAQTGGDGGIKAIRMAKKPNTPSAIDNTDASVKAVKVIRNGQLIILRDGKEFNILGAAVK